ncbi:hypothetical protein T265_01179 [Opisthorchis viverrini]|uniref:Ribosomal protein S11 n=1 Tax=Opisthorchis viverrini TaxID=6198 RepID=A0A075AJ76_OPIVI|nr:hypothetical protein T265_01179 [Opisthorchis viverrini]KER32899.1 hypothetical protein T265_01179 [Opisthorchis viverrini]
MDPRAPPSWNDVDVFLCGVQDSFPISSNTQPTAAVSTSHDPLPEAARKVDAPKILGHHIVTEECLTSIVGDRAFYELPVLHISAGKNNTFATLTDCNGRILERSSCSAEGFQNARKKTTVAAQTLGISMGFKAQKIGITTVRVKMRGLGSGRLPTLSGAALAGLQVVSLTDDTSMHYGHGKRPRKMRRK